MNGLTVFSLFLLAYIGFSCKCVPPTVEKTYCQADYIAHVKITKIETQEGDRNTIYSFEEIKKFKGDKDLPKQFETPSESSACGITLLKVGNEYLLALHESDKTLSASSCLGFPAENAALGSVEWKNVPQSLKDIVEKNPPKC